AEARRRADRVVVSIFVNPIQFDRREDFERYPRTLDADLAACAAAGADAVYTPSAATMYPEGFRTTVEVAGLTEPLCGRTRPGHFRGVTTVVTKLFHAVRPHCAVFGEKDWQQLAVIRRLAADLDFGVEIVGVPTVREPDGVALSSRNRRRAAFPARSTPRRPQSPRANGGRPRSSRAPSPRSPPSRGRSSSTPSCAIRRASRRWRRWRGRRRCSRSRCGWEACG